MASSSTESRTPLIAEIISGLIACCAVWLYQEESLALVLIFLVGWMAFFRKGLMTVAGAFLISLALDYYGKGQIVEFEGIARWIIVGIIIELILLVVWPLLKNRSLPEPSVNETAFFALIGYFIAYAIQINACQISVNVSASPNEFNQVLFRMVACQQNFLLDRVAHLPPSTTLSYWNEIAQIALRVIGMSPLFWLCIMASIRRIGFNPTRLGELPRYMWRAWWGVIPFGFLVLLIWFILFIAITFNMKGSQLSEVIPTISNFAFVFIGVDMFFSALGVGWATK
jgi:hypothetical protein